MRHEGLPLRGKGAADLPAAMRAVTTVQCSGQNVLAFWESLGFSMDHEMVQEGHCYVLNHAVQLQVCVSMCVTLVVMSSANLACRGPTTPAAQSSNQCRFSLTGSTSWCS